MDRLMRNGTAEPVSRDQLLRRLRGQGKVHFPCSTDHYQEHDRQPYPVDPHSPISNDDIYISYTHDTYSYEYKESARNRNSDL